MVEKQLKFDLIFLQALLAVVYGSVESFDAQSIHLLEDISSGKETAEIRLISKSNKYFQRRLVRESGQENAELHIKTTSDSFEFILNHVKPPFNPNAKIKFNNGKSEEIWHQTRRDCFMEGYSKQDRSDTVLVSYCTTLKGMFHHGNHSYSVLGMSNNTSNDGFQAALLEKTPRMKLSDKLKSSLFKATSMDNRQQRVKRAVTGTYTIEMVVILDKSYVDKLKENGHDTNESFVEVMALKWTGVQAEWSRKELGVDVVIDIKELVVWETNPNWYRQSSTIKNTLSSLCNGAANQNLWRDFDYIYLFTGMKTDYPGRAYTGKICSPLQKCGVSADYRINEFTTTAHELGHRLFSVFESMGMSHDYDVGCGTDSDGIMGYEPYGWSYCSVGALNYFLGEKSSSCLVTTNVLTDTFRRLDGKWPGMLYTRDDICELKRGPGFRYRKFPYVEWDDCTLHSCINMNTSSPDYGIIFNHAVPTDGTYCGDNKVCSSKSVNGAYTCISWNETGLDLSLFTQVNGAWSEWGAMTSCSRTCGTGIRYKQRTCDNPKPQNSAECEGNAFYAEPCNTQLCVDDSIYESELVTQRAGETCSNIKSNRLYERMGLESSNYLMTGERFYSKSWGQCEVKCDHVPEHTPGNTQRYGLMPDGTPCSPEHDAAHTFAEKYSLVRQSGRFGKCVQGYCHLLGCNNVTGDTRRDGCGVCGGDNTTCLIVEDVFTDVIPKKARADIVTLPAGAFNIQFYFPLSQMLYNILEVRTASNHAVINIKTLDTTVKPMNFANTYWYYTYYKQYLHAAGPIDRRVKIQLYNQVGHDNVGINYAYSLPLYISDCLSECENGGTWNQAYCDCDCPTGFYGPSCSDSCRLICWNGQPFKSSQCQCYCAYNMYGSKCACRYPFTGIDCQECKISSCENGGVFNQTACRCRCPAGFGGLDCSSTCEDTVNASICATNVAKGWCDTRNEKMEAECYRSCGLCVLSLPVCPVGTYITPDQQCVDCGPNTYQNETGQTSCKDCPAQTFNGNNGSISDTDCLPICQLGEEFNHGTDMCNACVVGYYKDTVGNDVYCTKCGTRTTTSGTGSTSVADCSPICQLGEEFNHETYLCDTCLVGYYKDTVGNDVNCTKCGTGTTTEGTGSTSAAKCSKIVCDVGKYSFEGTVCDSCPADTYQNETGKASCQNCPDNTYSDNQGATGIDSCKSWCITNPHVCSGHGTCIVTGRRNFVCDCTDGYEGITCQEKSILIELIAGLLTAGVLLLLVACCTGIIIYRKKKKASRIDARDAKKFIHITNVPATESPKTDDDYNNVRVDQPCPESQELANRNDADNVATVRENAQDVNNYDNVHADVRFESDDKPTSEVTINNDYYTARLSDDDPGNDTNDYDILDTHVQKCHDTDTDDANLDQEPGDNSCDNMTLNSESISVIIVTDTTTQSTQL